jgi:hypothetical protein
MSQIAKLVIDLNIGVPVTLSESIIPAFQYGPYEFDKMGKQELPKDLLLVSYKKSYSGNQSYYVQFYNPKNQSFINARIPIDFEINPKKHGTNIYKEMLDSYQDFVVIQKLNKQISHAGMKIGSDPEIFCEDADGEIIPAFTFLGSKDKPNIATKQNNNQQYNKIYWDGFQAEFDTDGSHCIGWQGDSVHNGLHSLYNLLIKHNPKAKLSMRTTFNIPNKLLKESEETHVQFGCMPSLNAYGMEGIKGNGRDVDFRSAGGHIHFGTAGLIDGVPNKDALIRAVKALDAILGVTCVSLFANWDDPRRRTMYGLAGEYRLPAHGLEYRVLSNAWLCHPLIMNVVMDLSRKAFMVGVKDLLSAWKCEEKETIRIINECDVVAARKVMEVNKKFLDTLFYNIYHDPAKSSLAYDIMFKGLEYVVENPTDLVNNWKLVGGWTGHCDGKDANMNKYYNYVWLKKLKAS